jgi:hypothetical protein
VRRERKGGRGLRGGIWEEMKDERGRVGISPLGARYQELGLRVQSEAMEWRFKIGTVSQWMSKNEHG